MLKITQPFIEFLQPVFNLVYPPICYGCDRLLKSGEDAICLNCISEMPLTLFENDASNPVFNLFKGRVQVKDAVALYFFNKKGMLQNLLHGLKYQKQKGIGTFFGKKLGRTLLKTSQFKEIDAIIPVPITKKRERHRGYNQSALIGKEVANILEAPLMETAVIRNYETSTQTHKGRLERWKNVSGSFKTVEPDSLKNKHLLLIDDVITTGSTLDALAHHLLQLKGISISIAAVAYADVY